MNKTATISARISPELKNGAERIFTDLGLTVSQAITLFYRQVELQQGLPFEVRMPNKTTVKALDSAKSRRNLDAFDTVDELFDDLNI